MSARFFKGQEIISIQSSSLDELKKMAESAPLRRSRFCLHQDNQDKVHEMVIAFCQDSYVRPHKHNNKSESFHIIEGELMVIFFDDQGKASRAIEMQPYKPGGCFLYRLSNDLWHTVVPLSQYVIIHEVTNGPFIKEESLFPPWAPDGGDRQEACQFIERVKRDVKENRLTDVGS